MDSDLFSGVGLIEPTRDSNKRVMVTRPVMKTSKMVPVKVANISPVGATIKEREKEIS